MYKTVLKHIFSSNKHTKSTIVNICIYWEREIIFFCIFIIHLLPSMYVWLHVRVVVAAAVVVFSRLFLEGNNEIYWINSIEIGVKAMLTVYVIILYFSLFTKIFQCFNVNFFCRCNIFFFYSSFGMDSRFKKNCYYACTRANKTKVQWRYLFCCGHCVVNFNASFRYIYFSLVYFCCCFILLIANKWIIFTV